MKRRKPYAEEFKQEVIKLVAEQGISVTHVTRDLDVSLDTLHRWLRQARSAASPATPVGISSGELARHKRENEQLRTKRDILKKRSACSRGCHTNAAVRVRRRPSEYVPGYDAVPGVGGSASWLLSLETPAEEQACRAGCHADHTQYDHFSCSSAHVWSPASPCAFARSGYTLLEKARCTCAAQPRRRCASQAATGAYTC
jgi:transposase